MQPPNPRILVIDDNPAIHEDFDKILTPSHRADDQGLAQAEALLFGSPTSSAFPAPAITSTSDQAYEITHALQGQEGFALVETAIAEGRPYSVAFIDMRMPPGWDGLETAERIVQADPSIQIVICTAYSDYSWDEIRKRLGVPDGLLILKKPFDVVEVLQIAHNLTRKWQLAQEIKHTLATLDRRVHERTAQLDASRERLAAMFQDAPMAQLIIDNRGPEGLEVNEAFCQLTGCDAETWRDHETALQAIHSTGLMDILRQSHPVTEVEAVMRHRNGQAKHVIYSSVVLALAKAPTLLLMIQDFTERRRLESDLRQLQKMEAVGQLAAGVAHDFNNLLTVIAGNAHMAREARGKGQEYEELLLDEIIESSARASDLTKQLLAFTRHQVFQPRQANLNAIVENQLSILTRLLGEHIEILWQPGVSIGLVSADIASIEQVILNLAINARDAMSGGGKLTLTTGSLDLEDEPRAAAYGVAPGLYVSLTCADTGHGMSKEVADRAFEPFFTTKETGKGTGLGLASAYGIIARHRGTITIDQEREQGAAFRIILPVDPSEIIADDTAGKRPGIRTEEGQTRSDSLRILLVEDEPSVRRIAIRLLESLGHRVIEAIDGHSGLAKWRESRAEIDLVISDMVMPGGMSGLQLANTLQSESPDLPIILASGYSREMLRDDSFVPTPLRTFLPKPYDRASLDAMIRGFSFDSASPDEVSLALPA